MLAIYMVVFRCLARCPSICLPVTPQCFCSGCVILPFPASAFAAAASGIHSHQVLPRAPHLFPAVTFSFPFPSVPLRHHRRERNRPDPISRFGVWLSNEHQLKLSPKSREPLLVP